MTIRNVRDATGPDNARYIRVLEATLRDHEERIAKLENTIQYLITRVQNAS